MTRGGGATKKMCVKTIMKNIRKALVIGGIVVGAALVLLLVLRGARQGGSLPAWTPGPATATPFPGAAWGEPTSYPEDYGFEYEDVYETVPAAQMPTTVPTVAEPSPSPLGIPFILPSGASAY